MLEKECMENKEYCNEASQHYIQLLLIFLKRTGYMRKQDGRRWSDLFMYLSEHYKTVTLDEVAEQMHISKNYFCRSFREKTGTTFLAYVNNLRIKAAIEQLLYTDMLISEIWRSVGFTQSKQFYKLFYNETGYTPGEFREAWKEHPEMIMNNSSQA
jgi:AraC-like DNA-binding protein